MRKRLIGGPPAATPVWLDLDDLATVEITSEDRLHPIESALLPGQGSGWLAALPGTQTIRLLFTPPQAIRRIRLSFVETAVPRTQEYLLRWSADAGLSLHEIVRQQWNFSPLGATAETEEHVVDLAAVNVLELIITPDIGNDNAFASLAELRIA